jgi:exodeoxyribonuclease VII large subunit
MRILLGQHLAEKQRALTRTAQRLARLHPRRRFQDWLQRLDHLQSSLIRCVQQEVRRQRIAWRNLTDRLSRVRPGLLVKQRRELLRQEKQRLREQAHHRLQSWHDRITALEAQLRLLGPEQVLARGYSITMEAETGKVVREAKQVRRGQRLRTRLKVGEVVSAVER